MKIDINDDSVGAECVVQNPLQVLKQASFKSNSGIEEEVDR